MRTTRSTTARATVAAAGAAALVLGLPAAQATGVTRPSAPAAPRPVALPAPVGHQLVRSLVGTGVQVYECVAAPGEASTWRSRPAATLRHVLRVQGVHDSRSPQGQPPVPQWTLFDGSRVVGRVTTGGTFPAPDPTRAIAALRLDVIEDSGLGALRGVDLVQRDLVRGGVGPTGACDAAAHPAPVVSPYRARYTFWATV